MQGYIYEILEIINVDDNFNAINGENMQIAKNKLDKLKEKKIQF
jgi:hypothetical protein